VVEKANYGTDLRTVGTVSRLLTRAPQHPRGFKVMLSDGTVGRCTELLERGAPPPPQQQRRPQKSESDEYLESLLVPPPPGIRLRDWEERQSRQRAPPPQMRARPRRTPRPYTLWLSAGLSDAERAAAAAAVEAIAGSSAVGSLAPFAHSRRSMLIEGASPGDEADMLVAAVAEALDSAADVAYPAHPVFVAAAERLGAGSTPPSSSSNEAAAALAVDAAVREAVREYDLCKPIAPAPDDAWSPSDATPAVHSLIDGATVGGPGEGAEERWDASSVVAVDGIVDAELRSRLLALMCGEGWDGEASADPAHWVAGALVDTLDGGDGDDEAVEALDPVRGSGLGLRPSALERLCAEPPDGETPAAVAELEGRIASFLHHANAAARSGEGDGNDEGSSQGGGGVEASEASPRVHVCRMAEACFGGGVTPLAANAPTAADGASCYSWHIDADPRLLPPSPWTDVHGRYPNRSPGKPRFVTALVYLNAEWRWPEWGAATRFLDPPSGTVLSVPPAPGRVVLLDQDVSHAVSAPEEAAGHSRPRYSLALKLVLHPASEEAVPAIAYTEWGQPACVGSACQPPPPPQQH